jgi:hypothetical protein
MCRQVIAGTGYIRGVARVVTMALVGLGGCGFRTNAAFDAPPMEPDAAITDAAHVDAPAFVQQAEAEAPNSNMPLVATLPAPPIAGHLLVAIGADEAGRLNGVTGGGVASWSLAAQSLANTNIEIWYGVTDGSSATVTVTADQDSLPMWVVVGEWSGPTTFDGAKSAYGSASPASAGAQSVHANDLVIFGVADQAPTTFGMPEGGWMPLMPARSNHTEQRVWFTVAAATGTLAPSVTETALSWDAAIAAFRH